MIEGCPAKRTGTPDEVGNVAALLMGPDGAFMVGDKEGGGCQQRHPSQRTQVLGALMTIRVILIGRHRCDSHHHQGNKGRDKVQK
jgi:hypothetical protein